jgi:sugar/nucleoside kinase (ribokinase family)
LAKQKTETPPSALLLGRLQRDFLLNAQGQAFIDRPGGNLLYATSAYLQWAERPGLIARVGNDLPVGWLEEIASRGVDVRGVQVLPAPHDLRRFIAYSDVLTAHKDHPVKHFAKLKLPFPKSLLGYERTLFKPDSKRERELLSLRQEDIPDAYHGVQTAHLCPMDFFSHSLMPAALRAAGVSSISLEAAPGYMHPSFWNEIPDLINGLTVFIVEEEELRMLFGGRSQDLHEMAEAVLGFNCQAVIVKNLARGQWLYRSGSSQRIHLPAYPARVMDITSLGSSFCGGFLAGMQTTQDPLRALLQGSVSASIAVEGSGAFYSSDGFPGLAESRLKSLEQAVQTY